MPTHEQKEICYTLPRVSRFGKKEKEPSSWLFKNLLQCLKKSLSGGGDEDAEDEEDEDEDEEDEEGDGEDQDGENEQKGEEKDEEKAKTGDLEEGEGASDQSPNVQFDTL